MDKNKKNAIKGYLYVITSAVLWASSGTASKALFEEGITPFELTQVRITLSALFNAIGLALFNRKLLRIRFKDLGYFLLLGCLCMGTMQAAYYYAISKIQVAAAILLQYLAPIFVATFAMCFWKERVTLPKLISLLLAFGGCYLVVGGYNLQLLQMNRMGVLAGLAAAVGFSSYTLLGERGMHRYEPWTVLFYALVFATLTWHVFYPPFQYIRAGFTLTQWLWILYIVLVTSILGFGLYFVAINYIRATRTVITATLEPIAAGFMAFFFLGEKLEFLQILGGCLVIGAIVMLQIQQEHDEMAPATIRERR